MNSRMLVTPLVLLCLSACTDGDSESAATEEAETPAEVEQFIAPATASADLVDASAGDLIDPPIIDDFPTCETEAFDEDIDKDGYSCIISLMGATLCHHMYGDWTEEDALKHCNDRDVDMSACMAPERGRFCKRDPQVTACVQHREGDKEVWIFQQFTQEICHMFVGDRFVSRPVEGWPMNPDIIDPGPIDDEEE